MRTIKFRAWNKHDQKMSEGCNPFNDNSFWFGADGIWCNDAEGNGLEVMQFTGLNDKNGVEIYEGDIIEAYTLMFKERKIRGSVYFSQRGSWMVVDSEYGEIEYLCELTKFKDRTEVIGNIYETPEKVTNG